MTDFGSDVSTLVAGDLDPLFTPITGVHVVGEAVARRLITPRGGLFYDPQFGFDVRSLLNLSVVSTQTAGLQALIQAECLKDERVLSATVSITVPTPTTNKLAIKVWLQTAAGPFQFLLTISQVQGLQITVFGK